jgi:hypothetical protein
VLRSLGGRIAIGAHDEGRAMDHARERVWLLLVTSKNG